MLEDSFLQMRIIFETEANMSLLLVNKLTRRKKPPGPRILRKPSLHAEAFATKLIWSFQENSAF